MGLVPAAPIGFGLRMSAGRESLEELLAPP
jgi:hypothetical protein